ncbi:methyltransferase-like protein 22 [Rhopalosiphum maidis]|uniref:methyltransferase-like protein 22 n=1 Tax=Rhopalosiphum maidis TaxID=43146 RepID=UPI000F007001|nr:methyltransferase-like protein 22 [Rhopalosiphum maidis]XP_026810126.1 methyltransferase-like protein 22 [Rhopalosiphum maidis]XP_026810127.1 methyltransferase-like protein 22 [Rhopalosiphum maidis]XP_026810128.1 methyltransferase-like protein 22 [Rhopalosiphum maidis]
METTGTTTNTRTLQSELFLEMNEGQESSETHNIRIVRSTFKFKCQPNKPCPEKLSVDEDGDLVVRRSPLAKGIIIEHINRTLLNMVGMQVWRSALLMGDFILENRDIFTNDQIILELGSGVGLSGIVAAMYCKEVIFTDINNKDILSMIEKNINLNQDLVVSHTTVLPLNFNEPELPDALYDKLKNLQILIAADVIYDNDITKQFVNTLKKIMTTSPRKTAYIAMEKRYVFSSVDLEVCAPCYEYFNDLLSQNNNWCEVQQLDCNFPQYFQYKKTKELVIFKLTANNSM